VSRRKRQLIELGIGQEQGRFGIVGVDERRSILGDGQENGLLAVTGD